MTKIGGRPSGWGASESRELKAIAPWVIIWQCHLPTQLRRFAMTFHSDELVQQVWEGFQALVAYVTAADAQT